ncbi:SH3 domain-containing protein [Archangium sp.]|uniref:SH3 domain-containing protein n=1 Tax=Archangium sp. TaxID=1872627 RepID=UPI00286B4EBE|nr:SH3 domain-containing protein [Archangium sp.]
MSLQRLPALLALACMMTGGPALAVKPPDGTLYIKAKNTHLKASNSPTADTLAVLQPGKDVTYEGKEPGSPWCKVRVTQEKKSPLQGFIYQANLAVSPPAMEVTSKNPSKPLKAAAFASSAAAIKALGPGAVTYSQTLPVKNTDKQLIALEQLAAKVSDAEVAEYAREGGLPEVVGSATVAKRPANRKAGK